MGRIKDFLTSKIFLLNLIGSLVFIFLLFGFTYKWLDSYTNHGSTVTVPDLRGLKVAAAENFLKRKAIGV